MIFASFAKLRKLDGQCKITHAECGLRASDKFVNDLSDTSIAGTCIEATPTPKIPAEYGYSPSEQSS